MKIEKISLEKLLTNNNIEYKPEYAQDDFLVIPNSTMTIEDISIIKQLRVNNQVKILNEKFFTYQDFRGGEFEIATFLVKEIALPLLIGCLSGLITYKIVSHEKGKQISGGENLKIPKFKLKIHRTEKDEHITLEGEADDVLKALEKLKEENESS